MDRAWNLGATGGWVSVRVIRYTDSARKEILSGVSVSAVCYHVTFLPRSLRHVYPNIRKALSMFVCLSQDGHVFTTFLMTRFPVRFHTKDRPRLVYNIMTISPFLEANFLVSVN